MNRAFRFQLLRRHFTMLISQTFPGCAVSTRRFVQRRSDAADFGHLALL